MEKKYIYIIIAAIIILVGGYFANQFFLRQSDNVLESEFLVEEAGIKFKLTQSIKDLVYVPQALENGATFFAFTTLTLSRMGENCGPGAIGSLVVIKTQPSIEGPYNSENMVFSEEDTFYYFVRPQASCSAQSQTQKAQTAQIDALRNALNSISKTSN